MANAAQAAPIAMKQVILAASTRTIYPVSAAKCPATVGGIRYLGAMATPLGLKRSLGYWDLVLYGLAYIAPFAPFSTLGFVWNQSNGLIVLAYLLGAVCMYFTAQSYATMTETLPTAGSVYGFARHSLGAFPGFVAGWMILLDYLLIPAFVYVLIAVALETLMPGIDRGVWIMSMVVATTVINWFGITVTSRANFISVALQVLIVAGFLVLGVIALYAGKGNGALTLKPVFDAAAFEPAKIFSATSICIMSFLGFDAVSTLAEEVTGGDRRVVGRAIIAVLVLSAAFFVAVTWVLGNLLPGIAIKDEAAAVYELAAWATGPWTAVILAWSYAGIVGLSNALPMQVGVARVVFAMGRDRQLPRILARVHPRYRTPYVGMLVTAALSLAVALYMRGRLDELASIVNFGALSGFLFLHLSVLFHFAVKRRSKAWIRHVLVPICGMAVVLAVFSGMSALAAKVGVAWLAAGVVYGLVLRIQNRDELRVAL
jgi:amino acid transporter